MRHRTAQTFWKEGILKAVHEGVGEGDNGALTPF